MGNSPSVPPPEQVYRASEAGRVEDLRNLALQANAAQPGNPGYFQRSDLLEWRDKEGRTPLIIATQRHHLECVRLLLDAGANVQHQSNGKYGSALHTAIFKECKKDLIDLLLRSGASPFVENSSGFTAMDYAMVRKNAPALRQLELHGLFAGGLKVKTSAMMGLKTGWSPRWVVAIPRKPYPALPASQQIFRRVLYVYNDRMQYTPTASMYLDGAKADMEIYNGGRAVNCVVTLHPNHIPPKGGLHLTGDAVTGRKVLFRSGMPTDPPEQLQNFCQMINQVHLPRGLAVEARSPVPDRSAAPPILHTVSSISSNPQNYPTIQRWGTATAPIEPQQVPEPNPAPQIASQTDIAQSAPSAPSAPPLPFENEIPEPPSCPPGLVPEMHQETITGGFQEVAYGSNATDVIDDGLCIICLTEPKEAGFVHGSSIHKCCCVDCAKMVMERGNKLCPVCRQPIENVVEHFY